MPAPPFEPIIFLPETIFTAAALLFCFLIYFRTKESYELTKYKGLMYFRGAFLFFGLSYLVRFLFGFVPFSRMAFDFILPRSMFAILLILPLGYFSTIGIFYLLFGLVWKNFRNSYMLIFGHAIALLLSVISFLTRSQEILLYLQCALLAIAIIIGFTGHTGKKISGIKILYIFVAGLWLINLLVIDSRRPLPPDARIFFQLISLAVFFIIYHKISKWVK
jgi:hypothetical protein